MAESFERQLSEFQKRVDTLEGDLPKVMAKTLNDVAFQLQKENLSRMDGIFEGGAVEWTKRSMVIDKATPDSLRVTLDHKPIQAAYLGLQEDGGVDDRSRPAGVRQPKRLAVPVDAPLDGHGNLPVDYVKQQQTVKGQWFGVPNSKKGGAPAGTRVGLFQRIRSPGMPDKLKTLVAFVKQRSYPNPKYGFREWAIRRAGEIAPDALRDVIRRTIERR
jgi:hypothetical protein